MTESGHNFAHVTTAQLLWHVQNCDLIEPNKQIYSEKQQKS